MQDPTHPKPQAKQADLFTESNCHAQRKHALFKIFHRQSLKELIQSSLPDSENEAQMTLGPGGSYKTTRASIPNHAGVYGGSWATVEIENGLFFDYKVRITSVKQDVESANEKSEENLAFQPADRCMNLIQDPDSDTKVLDVQLQSVEGVVSDQGGPRQEEKIVFSISVEVESGLRMCDRKKRYSIY